MVKKKKYRYFTMVTGQMGDYQVKHSSKLEMEKYNKKLAEQYPYFRYVKSGKL